MFGCHNIQVTDTREKKKTCDNHIKKGNVILYYMLSSYAEIYVDM